MANPDVFENMSASLRGEDLREQALAPSSALSSALENSAIQNTLPKDLPYPLDPHQMYSVQPDDGVRAVNAPANEKVYFINGMQMEQEKIYVTACELANAKGREVIVIPNNKEESFMKGLAHGVIAAFTDGPEFNVEQEAGGLGVEMLFTELENEESKTWVCGYSQGNLILKRSLEVFEHELLAYRDSLQPEQQELFQQKLDHFFEERFEVQRLGSPYNVTNAPIKSVNFQHPGDPVALLGQMFTAVERGKAFFTGQEITVSETIIAKPRGFQSPLDQHSIQDDRTQGNYLDDIALFEVARVRNLSPQAQAVHLVSSIEVSEYSQQTYDKIVKEFLNPRDQVNGLLDRVSGRMSNKEKQVFAESLLALAPDGKVKNNTFSTETMEALYQHKTGNSQTTKPQRTSPIQRRLRPGSSSQ